MSNFKPSIKVKKQAEVVHIEFGGFSPCKKSRSSSVKIVRKLSTPWQKMESPR